MGVYPSRMAPIGTKLWENAFQTIPDIAFFDINQKKSDVFFFFAKTKKYDFVCSNLSFWRSSDFLSVTGRFVVFSNCLPPFYFLVTTLGGGVNESKRFFFVHWETKVTKKT